MMLFLKPRQHNRRQEHDNTGPYRSPRQGFIKYRKAPKCIKEYTDVLQKLRYNSIGSNKRTG